MKLFFLKEIIYFSKYRNFSGGNFSLMLSIESTNVALADAKTRDFIAISTLIQLYLTMYYNLACF